MTKVTVRAQARGGMFLGQDSSNGAYITLKERATGKVLASGFTNIGDSGTRMPSYQPTSSTSVIVTPGQPDTIHWVTASESTVKFDADFPMNESTLIEFIATVPLQPSQGEQQVSMTQWISPDHNPSVGPGLVMVIPGLWVRPEVAVVDNKAKIRAKVTMMCGCEINYNSPWIPSDFQVEALISNGNSKKTIPLVFIDKSQFEAEEVIDEKGDYKLEIIGYQKSMGNTGVAHTSFSIS